MDDDFEWERIDIGHSLDFGNEIDRFNEQHRVLETAAPQIIILAPNNINGDSESFQDQENEVHSETAHNSVQEQRNRNNRNNSDGTMNRERPIQTLNLTVLRRRISILNNILRYEYRWFYNKKCAVLLILHLILLGISAVRVFSATMAIWLNLWLLFVSAYILLVERSRILRGRLAMMELIRIDEAHTSRQPSSGAAGNNQEISIDHMLEGLHLTEAQRGEIRQHFRLLNQLQNPPANQNPSNNLLHAPNIQVLDFFGIHSAERFLMQSSIDFALRAETEGLSKEQISSLMPKQKYQPPENELGIKVHETCNTEEEQENNQNCCTICLEPFIKDQEIRVSPCSHIFHVTCIDVWAELKSVCPNCKRKLRQTEAAPNQNQSHIEV